MKIKVNFLKGALLLLLFAASSSFALAQRTISGLVTDGSTGETLIGASVIVTGTTKGTLTDVDGKYSLDVPADAKSLTFSFTGYASLTVPLGAANTVNAALQGGSELNAVVISAGYQSIKAKEVTSSIASIKAEEFNKGYVNDPVQLLQGKVAGLSIARPGGDPNGNFTMRLRGLSTIGANTEPLVIVDGIPGADLNTVDPNDIESIDVLKDGSAAAIYGTRGSSGVLLVTTKKGTPGKTTVDYNGSLTTESVAKSVSVMTAAEYKAAGGTDRGATTDWFSQVARTANAQNHSLAFGGGLSKNTTFRVALNYRAGQGIALADGFNRLNGRFQVTQTALDDKLTLTASIAASSLQASFGDPNAFRYAAVFNPTAPVYAQATDANYAKYGGFYQQEAFDLFNPVAIVKQQVREGNGKKMLASVRAEYEIVPGLKYAMVLARDIRSSITGQSFERTAYYGGRSGQGFASRSTNESTNDYLSSTLTYGTAMGKTNLNFLAGYDYQDFNNQGFNASASGFITDSYSYNNLDGASDWKNGKGLANSYQEGSKLIAMFGSVRMSHDDTYYASASVRREGSTRFGTENKWGLFPAVSVGVNLKKFINFKGLDILKLRAGYGVTGNIPGENYLALATVGNGPLFFYNGAFVPTYLINKNANSSLKWETKAETNIGLDFAAMNLDLTGTLDVYTRDTRDLIYRTSVPVPPNLTQYTWKNVGNLKNSGIELLLNYKAIKGKDFNWTTGINLATFNTKIVSLLTDDSGKAADFETANVGAPGQNLTNQIFVQAGAPVGQIHGPVFTGIDANGNPTYQDINGDGVGNISDRTVIGNGLPKLSYGWSNTVNFGGLSLNFLLRGVTGHNLVNEYRVFYENASPSEITSWNRVKTTYWDPKLKRSDYSSRYVEKADYLRLDNITLAYDLPIKNMGTLSKARVYVSGNNLFTITNYTGVDPEVRYADPGSSDVGNAPGRLANPDPLAPGIDRRSTYFSTRAFTLGVNVSF
jgi:TonB-dependent starch-binding outer membrane protein SusC